MTKPAFNDANINAARAVRLVCYVCAEMIFAMSAHADEIAFTAPLDSLTQLNERPLFAATRRASDVSTPPLQSSEVPASVSLEGILLGLVKGDDEIGFVIVRLNEDSAPVKIRIGELFKGWQLTAIDNHAATFSREGQIAILAFP